jgi:hypothetical protein
VAWPWIYAACGGFRSFRPSCRTFSRSPRSPPTSREKVRLKPLHLLLFSLRIRDGIDGGRNHRSLSSFASQHSNLRSCITVTAKQAKCFMRWPSLVQVRRALLSRHGYHICNCAGNNCLAVRWSSGKFECIRQGCYVLQYSQLLHISYLLQVGTTICTYETLLFTYFQLGKLVMYTR